MKKAQRVDQLRRRILSTFAIRGATRKESFSTKKKIKLPLLGGHEIPIYHISPLYSMPAKDWVQRLQATIHAATGRAVGKTSVDWLNWRQTPAGRLPIVMVFGPNFTPRDRKFFTGKQAVLTIRLFLKDFGETKFKQKFYPHREQLEKGIVHGQTKPTFIESALYPGLSRNELVSYQPKLFEIRMSKREFYQICRRIETKLLRYGYLLESFERERREAVNARPIDKGKEQKLWQVALAVSGKKQFQFATETISLHPLNYLFTLEASRIMTNKLVKRGLLWVKKNIPED